MAGAIFGGGYDSTTGEFIYTDEGTGSGDSENDSFFSSLVGALNNIVEKISSFFEEFWQFFVIDTEELKQEIVNSEEYQNFANKFGFISDMKNLFDSLSPSDDVSSFNFSIVLPTWLGGSEVIILDLSYASSIFSFCRTFLQYALWLLYFYWLFNQIKINFVV